MKTNFLREMKPFLVKPGVTRLIWQIDYMQFLLSSGGTGRKIKSLLKNCNIQNGCGELVLKKKQQAFLLWS